MTGSDGVEGLRIGPLDSARIGEAVEVFLRAFEVSDPARAENAEGFWRLLHTIGAAGFVGAELGGRMVGCGALIGYRLSAWIAFMAVLPGLRGRGTGNALMMALMARAEEQGYETLKLDASNWGKPLYVKHGFRTEYQVRTHDLLVGDSGEEREEPSILIAHDIPEWCLAMDRKAFGDDRSLLLRQVLKEGGQLIVEESHGFGIIWKQKVGPVIADSVPAARNIVRYAQTLGAKRIYVPLHDHMPSDFLSDLEEVRPTTSIICCERMSAGPGIDEDRRMVFASFSAATG
jgi:GNAT superfamily N-acetyltransferase